MHPIVILNIILFSACVIGSTPEKENAREEKLRSALIDAFQNIKKASSKGDDDDLSPDLIGSMIPATLGKNEKFTTDDTFDLFADDDGLTFAEAFGNVETEQRSSTTEQSHNVQHIVKTTKQAEKTTAKPSNIIAKLADSIRNTVNESRMQMAVVANDTNLLGLESMLRIVDAEILVQQWNDLQKSVSGPCKEDLQEYVEGLQDKLLWALKSKSLLNILMIVHYYKLYLDFNTVWWDYAKKRTTLPPPKTEII